MGPEPLAQVLRPLGGMFPAKEYPNLLVGLEVSDDAAVYRISDELAVILTLDFFAPVVDDPYDYGAITRRRPPVACSSPCQRSWGDSPRFSTGKGNPTGSSGASWMARV